MNPPPPKPSTQPTSAETPSSNALKFSKKQLVLAFGIAGISDAVGVFTTPLPPITWVVDVVTALLLFLLLGRQWLLLPGLALEAIPGLGVLPRPADTNVYTANDALADSTSAPTSGGFTFTNAGGITGGSGVITDLYVQSS
jgi:hypothetical protein